MAEETITFNLELNVEQTIHEIRRLETLLFRTISLLRRLGLPENVSETAAKIQRLIMTIRMLHTALVALETATGPIGWALAVVGIGTAVVSFGDLIMEG